MTRTADCRSAVAWAGPGEVAAIPPIILFLFVPRLLLRARACVPALSHTITSPSDARACAPPLPLSFARLRFRLPPPRPLPFAPRFVSRSLLPPPPSPLAAGPPTSAISSHSSSSLALAALLPLPAAGGPRRAPPPARQRIGDQPRAPSSRLNQQQQRRPLSQQPHVDDRAPLHVAAAIAAASPTPNPSFFLSPTTLMSVTPSWRYRSPNGSFGHAFELSGHRQFHTAHKGSHGDRHFQRTFVTSCSCRRESIFDASACGRVHMFKTHGQCVRV